MGYSRRRLNYLKRIPLLDLTHLMSMVDLIPIGVETLKIDSRCYLKKEFNESLCMKL